MAALTISIVVVVSGVLFAVDPSGVEWREPPDDEFPIPARNENEQSCECDFYISGGNGTRVLGTWSSPRKPFSPKPLNLVI